MAHPHLVPLLLLALQQICPAPSLQTRTTGYSGGNLWGSKGALDCWPCSSTEVQLLELQSYKVGLCFRGFCKDACNKQTGKQGRRLRTIDGLHGKVCSSSSQ